MKRRKDIITIKKRLNQDQISVLLFMIFFVYFHYTFAYYENANQERQIHQLLAEHGVTTQAKIQECRCSTKSKNCDITYQYDVVISGQVATYIGEDIGDEDLGCEKGDVIAIKYLPETPTVTRLEESDSIPRTELIGFCFMHFPLLLLTFSAFASGPKNPDIDRDETFAAMKFKPTDSVAWLVLGHIFEAEGDKAKANDCLKEALSVKLAEVVKTFQGPILPLVPWASAKSEAQAKGTQLARWSKYNTAPARKPQLLSLSRIIKLPLQLSAILVWLQFFRAPLTTVLEAFLMVLLLVIAGGLTWRIVQLLQLGFNSHDWLATQALVIGSFIKQYKYEKKKGKEKKHTDFM